MNHLLDRHLHLKVEQLLRKHSKSFAKQGYLCDVRGVCSENRLIHHDSHDDFTPKESKFNEDDYFCANFNVLKYFISF